MKKRFIFLFVLAINLLRVPSACCADDETLPSRVGKSFSALNSIGASVALAATGFAAWQVYSVYRENKILCKMNKSLRDINNRVTSIESTLGRMEGAQQQHGDSLARLECGQAAIQGAQQQQGQQLNDAIGLLRQRNGQVHVQPHNEQPEGSGGINRHIAAVANFLSYPFQRSPVPATTGDVPHP